MRTHIYQYEKVYNEIAIPLSMQGIIKLANTNVTIMVWGGLFCFLGFLTVDQALKLFILAAAG